MFDLEQLNIIGFCAEECGRQNSGEPSVYDMINAWNYAVGFDIQKGMPEEYSHPKVSIAFIEHIGRLVEPEDNSHGFRTIPIYVGSGFDLVEKAPFWRIGELLEYLLASYYAGYLTPVKDGYSSSHHLAQSAEDQFYYEFENIHPFRDGNGRTGKILYNYLKGTLREPLTPPNFWGSSNP